MQEHALVNRLEVQRRNRKAALYHPRTHPWSSTLPAWRCRWPCDRRSRARYAAMAARVRVYALLCTAYECLVAASHGRSSYAHAAARVSACVAASTAGDRRGAARPQARRWVSTGMLSSSAKP